jgi:hypothetical protein
MRVEIGDGPSVQDLKPERDIKCRADLPLLQSPDGGCAFVSEECGYLLAGQSAVAPEDQQVVRDLSSGH